MTTKQKEYTIKELKDFANDFIKDGCYSSAIRVCEELQRRNPMIIRFCVCCHTKEHHKMVYGVEYCNKCKRECKFIEN